MTFIKWTIPAALLCLIPFFTAGAQTPSLGSFYGDKNLSYIEVNASPLIPPFQGYGGDLYFGFDTLSKRSRKGSTYQYFVGLALGGGGFGFQDAEFSGGYGERDVSGGYIAMRIENKLFFTTEGDVRPYVGANLGVGRGAISGSHLDEYDSLSSEMMVYAVGAEAGAHIRLTPKYFLTVALAGKAEMLGYSSDYQAVYPISINIGACRWRGRLK